MVSRLAAAALLVALANPAAAQSRALAGWLIALDACARCMEEGAAEVFSTGRAAGFEGWHLAHPGGGVCNHGPEPCLGAEVTFIVASGGNGAATLTEVDPRHNGRLTCAHTPNPPHHTAAEHARPTADRIAAQVAGGRLRPAGPDPDAPAWLGCRAEGEAFLLTLSFDRPLDPVFVFAAAGRPCDAMVS